MNMGARILVVEDDRDNMGLFRFLLERQGHTVYEAYDGRQGVEVARKELPDLILLDLAMPEMDGWTCAKILKSDPSTQNIKIVVVTVRSLPEDRKRAMDVGVDGYVTKPMSITALSDVVTKFLGST
jgi:two-component system, cell cycle response regulator DivK